MDSVGGWLFPLCMRLTFFVALSFFSAPAFAATFCVDTSTDSASGNNAAECSNDCATKNSGQCSLREAIMKANQTAGSDTIAFGFANSGSPVVITLATGLPTITETLNINGYSQPGSATASGPGSATIRIELNCNNNGGLDFAAGYSALSGVAVYNVGAGQAINVRAGANYVAISGNHIGLTASGSNPQNTSIGVYLRGDHAVVGGGGAANRNVISGIGSGSTGIAVWAEGNSNTINGNYIGLTPDGVVGIQNGTGVLTTGYGNVIGTGNVIAAGVLADVDVAGPSTSVVGNYIGLTKDGTATGVSTGAYAVRVTSGGTGSSIGGATGGDGNFIGSHSTSGVEIWTGASVTVQGNVIGLGTDGNAAPNQRGIWCNGGGAQIYDNVVSGNSSSGIELFNCGMPIVLRNKVGTGADGVTARGNGYLGINVSGSTVAAIGDQSYGNTIAYNTSAGVWVSQSAAQTAIYNNSIHSNGGLGIDIGTFGATPNDGNESDGIQNYPVITALYPDEAIGTIKSAPSTPYRISIFDAESCDGSGYGEGRTLIGTANVTTDASGNATFDTLIALPAGHKATATLTHWNSGVPGRTSEFAACAAPVAPGAFVFSASSVSVAENAGSVTLTVNRTGGTDGAVSVSLSSSSGTATSGTDFTAVNTTLNFANGESSKTVTINITADALIESDETFTVTLDSTTGGATIGAPGTETVTINNVTAYGSLAFSASTATVDEHAGTVTFTINRTGGSVGSVAVNFATSNGTAASGSDYQAVSQSVSFADGETTKTVSVAIFQDAVNESSETFTGTLSSASGGATLGAPSTMTVTITNVVEHGSLALSASSASVSETANSVPITIVRTGGSSGTVTVDVTTSSGSATSGSDFAPFSQTITFYDGDTTQTIYVSIYSDALAEGTETFYVSLSNPTGAATLGATTSETVSITNVAAPGSFVFATNTISVQESIGGVGILIYRVGGAEGDVQVTASTASGTATSGSDFTAVNQTFTFLSGETLKTVVVYITDDHVGEIDESFTLQLSGATNGATTGSPSTMSITITTSANPGTLALSANTYSVTEDGGSASVVVTRSGGADGAVSATIATSSGSATSGSDFTAVNQTVTFNNGETSKTISIPIATDAIVESNETFTVALSNAQGGASIGSPSSATVTITDATVLGTVGFSGTTASVLETDGSVVLTLVRTGDLTASVSVNVATSPGSATAGSDYQSVSQMVAFISNAATATVTIPITSDALAEGPEAFTVSLSSPSGATLGLASTATVTINDAPSAGSLAFASASYSTDETGGTIVLTINRSGGSSGAVSVTVASSNGTAVAGSDYQAVNQMVSFGAGETSKTVAITIVADAVAESSETFAVALSSPQGGAALGAQSSTTVTITEAAAPVPGTLAFAMTAATANEESINTTLVLTVNRSNGADGVVSVDVSASADTALAAVDFLAAPTTLVFASGEVTKDLMVTVFADDTDEDDETFTLTLSNPTGGAALGNDHVTVTIHDPSDSAPPVDTPPSTDTPSPSTPDTPGGASSDKPTTTGNEMGTLDVRAQKKSGCSAVGDPSVLVVLALAFFLRTRRRVAGNKPRSAF